MLREMVTEMMMEMPATMIKNSTTGAMVYWSTTSKKYLNPKSIFKEHTTRHKTPAGIRE